MDGLPAYHFGSEALLLVRVHSRPLLHESGMSGRCVSAPLFLENMEWNN